MTENPKTLEELVKYIEAQKALSDAAGTDAEGYGAAAQYVANVAVAAFNFAAHEEGITGFQASWADLEFLAKVRNLKGPFAILDSEKMLYPQYPTAVEQAREYEEEWKPWLAKEAKRLMTVRKQEEVAPRVWAHWEKLAAFVPAEEP